MGLMNWLKQQGAGSPKYDALLKKGLSKMPVDRYLLASYGLPLTHNERKLAALKNKHKGRRCFIIGNGPSLKKTDIRLLRNEITFGVNRIYLLFPEMGYTPTYYVVADHLDAEYNSAEIRGITGTTKLFPAHLRYCLPPSPDTVHFSLRSSGPDNPLFSRNALKGVYGGENVTSINIQLAYYMGIRDVYLIGVDFDWGQDAGKLEANVAVAGHAEATHFSPNYRRPGEVWRTPDLVWAEKAFGVAKQAYERDGRTIYNATIGGKLEVFPRVRYEDVVSSSE